MNVHIKFPKRASMQRIIPLVLKELVADLIAEVKVK